MIYSSIIGADQQILTTLAAQGHTIETVDEATYDIILGPQCWRAFSLKHLDLAMKSARAVKYVKKSEAKPKKPRAARKKKGDPGPEHE